ncbi:MAG: proline dehydrogenase family protein [Thermoanaerobaculia bacterium]|nr:proline dehydrogenase family protein [Thermoanaerobaculia bacterium]
MSLFDRLIVTTLPLVPKFIVGKVASRYVAGESLDDAVETVKRLNGEGALCTLDVLGEEVDDRALAQKAVDQYLQVLGAIVENDLNCNISAKPTQFGLEIDESLCRDHYETLASAAAKEDCFVRLDMEDRTTTDATLRIYRQLHESLGLIEGETQKDGSRHRARVGPVFQAYMRRTLNDIADLPAEGANVRLCKGIYIEPIAHAWKGFETVRLNFVQALRKLLEQGTYVGIATHDEYLMCAAVGLLDELQVPKDRYEFQMLLGVEPQLRRVLIDGGHRLRVYVPYGKDWYLYSMRRLRENPKVAGHVARALLSGN